LEEEKNEPQQPTPPNPYNMNDYNIILIIRKNFRAKGKKKWTIQDMRQEYFNIVVAKKLESQEWIDYHRNLLEIDETKLDIK
jgi:hypothetical protein